MTQFLPAVPQTWWTGTREEPVEQPKPTEPSVTANVAVIESADEKPTGTEMTAGVDHRVPLKRDRRGKASSSNATVTAQAGGRVSPAPTDDEQQAATRDVVEAVASHQSRDGGEEQVERLKAALNEDARRKTEPNRMAGFSGEARARVDSLLSRARRLFDVGRLNEARQTAQIAQELSETARLDYSPDEERPIDLVHRIDGQLQAMQEPPDEAHHNDVANDVAGTDRSKVESPPDGESKTTAVESAGGRSWLGRGMNVFRRDRKSSTTDVTIIPAADDGGATQVSLSLELDGDTGSHSESRAAVVQANRSVALSTVTSPKRTVDEFVPAPATDREDGPSPFQSEPASTESDSVASEISDARPAASNFEPSDSLLDDSASDNRDTDRRLTADDTVASPPALEDVRPVSPFRNVAGHTKASQPSRPALREPPDTIWGWAAGAACLLACSLLALTCYRRGAT